MSRIAPALVIAIGLLIGTLSDARAHGSMVTAEPRPDSVVPDPPDEVRIEFIGALDVAASGILISGPDGESVATSAGAVEPTASGTTALTVSLPNGLAAGRQTVFWTAQFTDGHLERGAYEFTTLSASTRGGQDWGRWLGLSTLAAGAGAVVALIWRANRRSPTPAASRAAQRRQRRTQATSTSQRKRKR